MYAAGILELSQSIIEVLYAFFPQSIDNLNRETSPIQGDAPVVVKTGKNESSIRKIFTSVGGNRAAFGANQVVLVRDEAARKKISKIVGKHALILTIIECRGLELEVGY